MGVQYTLGFKSGAQIEIEVANPKAFLSGLRTTISARPQGAQHWSFDRDLGFSISDLSFAVPSTMVIRNAH